MDAILSFLGGIISFIPKLLIWLVNLVLWLVSAILSLLPDSPFKYLEANADVQEVLGYVNYIIPIDFMVVCLELWVTAIIVFYGYQFILRWIKILGD